ncbi:MAG: class I poly(R)-hydroxyalkanoic acid synthase [Rhodospirillales bacterium]|nr:class I poly(R)-hydroxyalkanoic acid synthase [Rhodospirillales bacterium]
MTKTTQETDLPIDEWQAIAERSQRVMADFMARQGDPGQFEDMRRMGEVFMQAYVQLLTDPVKLAQAQVNLWKGYMDLWQATARRMAGEEAEPVVAPARDDRRFRDESWSENAVFDYMKQSYLLSSNWLQDLMGGVEGLDRKTKKKLDFYTKLYVDALSPTNFATTNPEVLRATAETKGDNLVKGLENLLDDFERGKGQLSIRMVDEDAFEVGVNLATTPGKVVYQNDLIQLIQFDPTTETVHRKPLLIMPPWINKYYILDLKPQNSFIRWAVEQGQTVFVISWVNPDAELAKKDLTSYMLEGPLAALDAIEQATGEKRVNVLGYCIGGTLLACTLGYMAAHRDNRIASATYLTSLIDFEEVGDIEVFIDEDQVEGLEAVMTKRGYLEGSEMAATFNTLRANDLIWSFVINNYLLGKDPFPFDILYWNGDSTRMPAAMHSEYLRRMYLDNALSRGELELDGTPIDLTKIKTPSYLLSTREDHIAPWDSTYKATRIYGGNTRFTLAMSGHVAGVVNPPARDKYGYWTNAKNPADPEEWLAAADKHDGSWWPDWMAWLQGHAGARVPARTPGDRDLKVIEDAPGSYIKVDLRDPAQGPSRGP